MACPVYWICSIWLVTGRQYDDLFYALDIEQEECVFD